MTSEKKPTTAAAFDTLRGIVQRDGVYAGVDAAEYVRDLRGDGKRRWQTTLMEAREEEPTDAAIDLACASARPDFAQLPTHDRNDLRRQAADWHRAWNREE